MVSFVDGHPFQFLGLASAARHFIKETLICSDISHKYVSFSGNILLVLFYPIQYMLRYLGTLDSQVKARLIPTTHVEATLLISKTQMKPYNLL